MTRAATAVLVLCAAACGGASSGTRAAAAPCVEDDERPVCQVEAAHRRAVRLELTMQSAADECRAAGDETRATCVATLTPRAQQIVYALSDPTRVERDPTLLPSATTYVDALEETFWDRCMGADAP